MNSEPRSGGPSYGTVDKTYGMRLATTEPALDGPIWMVNLMKYKEVASYGSDASDSPVSGREADDRYAPTRILKDLGAEMVFVGDVETQLLGAEPKWDRVAVVKYPTRRSFVEMQNRPDFKDKHVHKSAGMDRTIVMGCQPVEAAFELQHDQPDWATVQFPPTEDDGPVAVLHVISFDADHRDQMAIYQNHAARIAAPHGARVGAWFDVEGTIVGDGRRWDQARFNLFPSRLAFMAVVHDPERLRAQAANREPAMSDTYTMIIRPTLNRLDGAL